MYFIFFFIILGFNFLHRLQSIISEIFILLCLIITFLYSPIYFSSDCKLFMRMLSIKNYFFDQFLYEASRYKSLKNISQEDPLLKDYFLYQKIKTKGIIHTYVVSTFTKTFSKILSDNKIVDINGVKILLNQYPILKDLKIGQVIYLITVKGHGLRSLLWKISSKESRVYNRVTYSNYFMENTILKFSKSNKWNYVIIVGRLHDNFINSIRSLGLDENNIQTIIHALQWQLNFQKLHAGDRFSVLLALSKNINNCNGIKSCNNDRLVVAVRLHSAGKDYYAFRADNGRFYNREAVGIVRDFIRFPTLKPFRISSNFSLSRLNPITGRISPHLGVDFAVPIGTPVFSVGDGEVVVSKYGQISGNYIVIRHSLYCITRYMHLDRLLVKSGQAVKRGENIALSGNTGRSTGPHLHFEVWINHKAVNPLTATFLYCDKLHGCDRINYFHKINSLLPYLKFNS